MTGAVLGAGVEIPAGDRLVDDARIAADPLPTMAAER